VAELLFWPALLAYGEAAVAYFGETRIPGWPGRLATWGVRLGWLAQTALLIAQAARADGFPWSTWAGSLNLFVWLVVTAYLVVFAFVLVYFLIMALKLARLEREVGELAELARKRADG